MKGTLTELDRRIIETLKRDARISFRALAKRLGVSTPTISKRVGRLEQAGIIRGYTVVTPDLPEETARPATEPLACAHCKDRVEGPPRMQRFGGVTRVFCCDYCAGAYAERYNRAVRRAGRPLLGLVLLTSAFSFGLVGFSCGSAMCADAPRASAFVPPCPPWMAPPERFHNARPTARRRSVSRSRCGLRAAPKDTAYERRQTDARRAMVIRPRGPSAARIRA